MGKNYRPEIDGLRAIAVLPVLFAHAGFDFVSGGFLGVDIFFVISGYLIGGIIYSELSAGTFSLLKFYERRARRILPALFTMLIGSYVAGWFLLGSERFVDFAQDLISVVFFVSNIVLWFKADYFAVESELNPLLHTWSLSVEEQFYILFPLFLMGAIRWSTARVCLALIAIAVVSLVSAEMTRNYDPDMAFFMSFTRVWELAAGALIAISGTDMRAYTRRVREAGTVIGLALVLIPMFLMGQDSPHPGMITLLPVTGAVMLIVFARHDTIAARVMTFTPMRWIGLISYSLYLVHQPVFAFMRIAASTPLSPIDFLLPMVCCLLLATFMWRWIEQPARKSQCVPLRSFAGASTASGILLLGLGVATWGNNGMPTRSNQPAQTLLAKIESGRAVRHAGIGMTKCHFNEKRIALKSFLAQMDCIPDVTGPRILVFGDSHAADKAWALREVRVNVGNISGAGCPLTPSKKRPNCAELQNHVTTLVRSGAIDAIILAQRWRPSEITKTKLEEIADYWQDLGVPILIFTPMPEFYKLDQQIIDAARSDGTFQRISFDVPLLLETEPAVIKMAKSAGFTVLNTADLFCDNGRANCDALRNGEALLLDYGHLSELGSNHLGTRIVASENWMNWLDQISPDRGEDIRKVEFERDG